MKPLPRLTKSQLKYGIQPLKKKTRRVKEFDNRGKYQIVGFDTESYLNTFNQHRLHTAQISYLRSGQLHTDFHVYPKRGLELLNLFPKKAYVFAHFLEFDLSNLIGNDVLDQFRFLPRKQTIDGWTGHFIFSTMNLAHFKNRKEKKDLYFLDSMNFRRGSLANVSAMWLPERMRKLPKPHFLGQRPPTNEEFPTFQKYAIRDSEVSYWLGCQIYEEHIDRGIPCQYTPSGRAAVDFRTNYLNENWLLPNSNYINFIWNCYKGARFEAYGRGMFYSGRNSLDKNRGELKIYDINSLYPYAAIQPMPFESAQKIKSITLEQWERDKDIAIGWVHATGKYKDHDNYPQLPQFTSKMFYPLKFETWATTYELKNALNKVDIDKISILAFYPTEKDTNHPMRNYVLDKYREKKQLDELKKERPLTKQEWVQRNNIKLDLNSLYGKTTERNQNELTKIWKAGKLFNPSIGSLITGFARAEISKNVGQYEALYADTDSVFTYKTIPTSEELGKFKLEATGNVLLIRPKLYFVFEKDSDIMDLTITPKHAWPLCTPATQFNKLIKYARHSFRINAKDTLNLMKWNTGANEVDYEITKISKFKESIKRMIPTLSQIKYKCKVNFKADNKRQYHQDLNSVQELATSNCLSCPITLAPSQNK